MRRRLLTACLVCAVLAAEAAPWMGKIDDSRRVADLSLPGCHDACTGSGWLPADQENGERLTRTQELDLSALWQAGVRAFDLRPAVVDGELRICHGRMRTRLTLRQALTLIADSLRQEPTEMAVVVIKHENDGDDPGQGSRWSELASKLMEEINQRGQTADFEENMTLGTARGKIVFLCRTRYAELPVGAYIDDWTSEADFEHHVSRIVGTRTSAPLYVQDYYITTTTRDMRLKTKAMRRLQKMRKSGQISGWTINHASAYALTTSYMGEEYSMSEGYRKNASHTNRAMLRLAKKRHGGRGMGIVMMDYAGVDHSHGYAVGGRKLVQAIIASNFGR